MFWGDWGLNPKIERADMDGGNRVVLVDSKHLGWPNGLAIDFKMSRLYWVDGRKDVMMSVNLNGSEVKTVLTRLHHPFGIDILNGYVYWDDWIERKLFRANLTSPGTTKEVLLSNVRGLMEIQAVHNLYLNDEQNGCYNTRTCQQLCLLKPYDQKRCACQDGYKLASDNRNCVGKYVTAIINSHHYLLHMYHHFNNNSSRTVLTCS